MAALQLHGEFERPYFHGLWRIGFIHYCFILKGTNRSEPSLPSSSFIFIWSKNYCYLQLLDNFTWINVSLLCLDFTHHYSSIPEGTSRFAVSLDQALPLRGDILVSFPFTFCLFFSNYLRSDQLLSGRWQVGSKRLSDEFVLLPNVVVITKTGVHQD